MKSFMRVVLAGTLAIAPFSSAAFANMHDESKFSDPELLTHTLLRDEQAAVDAAEPAELDAAKEALEIERELTEKRVEELSPEQLRALNQKLNNTVSSGLIVDFDADDLESVIYGEYDLRQITALTRALEAEASFLSKADRFRSRYAETDDPKFREQAERFEVKAGIEREKFLAKIDRFDDPATAPIDGHLSRQSLREAKRHARGAAKDAARAAASDAARKAARDAAKDEARMLARAEVRDAIKGETKKAEKRRGKPKKDR